MNDSKQVRESLNQKAKAILEYHKSCFDDVRTAFISNTRCITGRNSPTVLEFNVTVITDTECIVCEETVQCNSYTVSKVLFNDN